MEEGSAGVHTDSEGEERKAKCAQLSGDAQVNSVGFSPCGQDDCKEKDSCCAQADALDLDVAKGHSHANEEEQEQDRLISKLGK